MTDFFLFFIGCFVSLIVLSAVGMLLWGAANEPRGQARSVSPRRSADSRVPVPVPVRSPAHFQGAWDRNN